MKMHEILEKLHTSLAEDLLEKIQGGAATAADLSVARQFLKDNGIDSLAFAESPLTTLATVLPFEHIDEPVAQVELSCREEYPLQSISLQAPTRKGHAAGLR